MPKKKKSVVTTRSVGEWRLETEFTSAGQRIKSRMAGGEKGT